MAGIAVERAVNSSFKLEVSEWAGVAIGHSVVAGHAAVLLSRHVGK